MMQQTSAALEQELVEPVAAYGPKSEEEKEPDAPEAFEFVEDWNSDEQIRNMGRIRLV